jgi:hypothetical protein
MTDRDRDDTYYDSATIERTRRQKKTLPTPLLRLLLVLAAIIVVVVIIVFAARSAIHSGEAGDYQRYMVKVADILERSDALGADLEKLLTSPGETNRTQIQTKLEEFVTDSEGLEAEAKALEAPKDLVEENVHQIFLLVMNFRYRGVADLKPSLMSALEVQDTEVAAEQISHALYYLVNSDFLYDEVFITQATAILQKKELTGVKVPSSNFIDDSDLASARKVVDILTELRSTGNLQATHGVAVGKVVAMPDEKEMTAGGTFNLTSSDELVIAVTVENQGNMEEKNVPVVVTLTVGNAEPQKVTVEIPQIKAKKELTVNVEGLNPTAYGEVAQLTVKVGPVQGEKYIDNNTLKASVIFKL